MDRLPINGSLLVMSFLNDLTPPSPLSGGSPSSPILSSFPSDNNDFGRGFEDVDLSHCETPVDITEYNFSDYDFPRTKSVFKPFTHVEYIKIIITMLVIFVALVGNVGIIIAVSFNRSLRTTINLYLVNLAVADILICACCMSVYLINQLTEVFVLGPIVCKLNAFCQMTCLTSSVLTLSAISCDRFIAIIYPLQARFRVTKHRTGILIVVIWITSLVVSLPFLVMRKHYVFQWRDYIETNCLETWPAEVHYDPSQSQCITTHPTKKIYYTFVTVALFFVPILIMATAYTCVVWKLWANVLPGEHNVANINHQHQAKKKVIKMVCLMLVAFIACWLPLQVVVLYSQFWHSTLDGDLPSWFNQASYLATFIAYSNSALNPIIYGGFNQAFRETLCSVFSCNCKRAPFQPSRKSTRTVTLGSLVNGNGGHTTATTMAGHAGHRRTTTGSGDKYVAELIDLSVGGNTVFADATTPLTQQVNSV